MWDLIFHINTFSLTKTYANISTGSSINSDLYTEARKFVKAAVLLPSSNSVLGVHISSPNPQLLEEEPIDADEEVEQQDDYGNGNDFSHHADDDGHEIDQVGDVDDECVILDDDDEEEEGDQEYDDEHQNGDGEAAGDAQDEEAENNGDEEANNDINGEEENTGDTGNMDNDESINLTIGEDEQKLLHDEVIETIRPSIDAF